MTTGEQIDFQSKQIIPFKSMELTNKKCRSEKVTLSTNITMFYPHALHPDVKALFFLFVHCTSGVKTSSCSLLGVYLEDHGNQT